MNVIHPTYQSCWLSTIHDDLLLMSFMLIWLTESSLSPPSISIEALNNPQGLMSIHGRVSTDYVSLCITVKLKNFKLYHQKLDITCNYRLKEVCSLQDTSSVCL